MIASRKELMDEYRIRARDMGLSPKVMPDGAFEAEIMIIGEGPGETEIRTGVPFSGGAGQKLWNQLRKAGVRRQDCYITNVVKRQISLSKKTDERNSVSKQEMNFWVEMARWELAQLPNIRYIVCLGNAALRAITNNDKITQWRGSVINVTYGTDKKARALCTFNPAHVLRESRWEVLFDFDINKIKMLRDDTYERYDITHHINPSFDDAMDWIVKMRNDREPIALDIESVGYETACIGLANEGHEGMCINFRTIDSNRYTLEEEIRIRKAIQMLSDHPDTRYVAQNGGFDSYWTWYKDHINYKRIWFDTLLAHHTLYPSLPHNLGALTAQYTTHPYYKDDGDTWREKGNINQFWEYNVKDCCITWEAHRKLYNELKAQKLDTFFFEHVMELQPHLVRATVLGIKVDENLKAQLNEAMTADVEKLREEFLQLAREASDDPELLINPNSFKQLRTLFFQKLSLVGRGTGTDALNRRRMREHHGTPTVAKDMLTKLDKYKEESKFLSTYVGAKIDEDGRIRCEYKQFGTQEAPGRLSSAKVMWDTGMNLQNQPERAYEMFLADPGCGFAYFDLEQAEARVVGWRAGIEKWINDFERARIEGGYDCHRALASDMWGIPYDDVPKKDIDDSGRHTKRYTAKRCRHGLNYRMGPYRLSEVTGLPYEEAASAYRIYHHTSPEVKEWWDVEVRLMRENGYLMSFLGRRLLMLERMDDSALDSIIAFKPQSTIGDKVCQVWYQSENDPEWPWPVRIAMNIHDALIAHGPTDLLPHALAIMKKYAESPIIIEDVNGVARELIIPIAGKISQPDDTGMHRWSTLQTVEVMAA